MTAVLDNLSTMMERLIETCLRSQRSFKAAAEAARNEDFRRLLNIYSHQRIRFAGELRHQFRIEESFSPVSETAPDPFSGRSDEEILEHCLQFDSHCLNTYSQALANRFPGRAHLLISAQYSLMQQVHARMRGLAAKSGHAKVTAVTHSYEV